jgi:hypothetical protein
VRINSVFFTFFVGTNIKAPEPAGETIFSSNLASNSILLEAHHSLYAPLIAQSVQQLQEQLEQDIVQNTTVLSPAKMPTTQSFFASGFASTYESPMQQQSPTMNTGTQQIKNEPNAFLKHCFFVMERSKSKELDSEEDVMQKIIVFLSKQSTP